MRMKTYTRVILAAALLVLLVLPGPMASGWCPPCTYCPPEYTEVVGTGNCVFCLYDACWVSWPWYRGNLFDINIGQMMENPVTGRRCFLTTTCEENTCWPLDCPG